MRISVLDPDKISEQRILFSRFGFRLQLNDEHCPELTSSLCAFTCLADVIESKVLMRCRTRGSLLNMLQERSNG
jgi:hypothetical protein